MAADDPFAILGVCAEASPARLRAAFRERAFRLHPDRNPGDPRAEERFKRLVAAYRAALSGLPMASARASRPRRGACDGQPPPPPPIRERYVCPRCDDTFPVPEPCFRCGDEPLDSHGQADATVPWPDPRVETMIADLERPREPPLFEPGPDLPFAAAVLFGVVGAGVVHVGLVPLGGMLLAFGAGVVAREIHARRQIARPQIA